MSNAEYDDVKKEIHRVTSDNPDHQKTCYCNDNWKKVVEAADNAGLGEEARALMKKIHAATTRSCDVSALTRPLR
jgi:hypothetical protein